MTVTDFLTRRPQTKRELAERMGVPLWRELMGMPWAEARGLSLAIPPIYTEWIGRQLLAAINADLVA